MRKLLSSPVKMPLSAAENQVYQNALKYVTPLSLNLMAIKVTHRPDDFLGWCGELIRLCREELNMNLLEEEQFLPLKKLQDILEAGFTVSQFKMARIAPWPIFLGFIEQQNTLHALDERLRLLNYIDGIRQQPLAELIEEDRLTFAGKHTSLHDHSIYNFDVEWFAGTKGAKVFHSLLAQFPEKFDVALAHIPLTGDVTYEEYQQFVSSFKKIFTQCTQDKPQGEKAPLAAATRLLAMRRPDQFIALNNNKIDVLCQGLSIAKFSNSDFSSYWHDMIGTLRTFAWWHQAQPEVLIENVAEVVVNDAESGISTITDDVHSQKSRELTLWKNRAVLIDLFLFADVDLAQHSNFIRLRDKVLNKKTGSTKVIARKRTKESAEMLVDKALTADDLPEYLLGKRDSIVNQVKNGKSVEQAIGLMRAIFG
jgi:hypothetical protein